MAVTYRQFTRRALTVVVIVALVAGIILALSRVSSLLVMIFTAWVIAVTLEVPVRWLQRLKLPRPLAVVISILVLLALGVAFIALVLPPFIQQADALISGLPDAISSAAQNYDELRDDSLLAARVLPAIDLEQVEALLEGDFTLALPLFEGMSFEDINMSELAGVALPVLREIGSFVASALANLFLIALLALLLLLEPVVHYEALLSLVPRRSEVRALEILSMTRDNVVTWLGAMLISTAITTVLFLIVLGAVLRLPNALALSLLAGVATFVPTFGPTIALIPIALVAAAEGLNTFILTVALYAAVGLVQDRAITPAIMRSELNIPAATLVFFQLVLAVLIGPLGLLLAVPILAILVTLVRELFVYDVLNKKGTVAEIETTRGGELMLAPVPQDVEAPRPRGELAEAEPDADT